MTSEDHIVFAGGGTAGHLFPGLAVAAELARHARPPRITFAGSGKTFEARRVGEAGFTYRGFSCAAFRPRPRDILQFVAKSLAGTRAARRFLRRERVSLVVGLGGYASLPMVRAAVSTGTPFILLEQNAYPGKATRWFASRADLVCAAFEAAQAHLNCIGPLRVTGNPIRSGFRPRASSRSARSARRRLLILGGSGGARSLNLHVPPAIKQLRNELGGWQIVHQTGAADSQETQDRYRTLGLNAVVVANVRNMAQVLRRADLAICRAGGCTLSELAATGTPAILIPYPHAAADHQQRNADVFVRAGAAQLIDERQCDSLSKSVSTQLAELLPGDGLRNEMSAAMLRLARPDAAWQVAMYVRQLVDEHRTLAASC
jgi:UDP-N-acetylglucosamine--N-acetylmuramyl-(pentapeptide) pyrophosphoryl-undecaprenol N-acetylglucosamine transferase